MFRMNAFVATVLAGLAFSVLGSSTASAVSPGWLVNGTLLTGTQTAAVATTAAIDTKVIFGYGGIAIRCSTSALQVIGPQIESGSKISAASVLFKECKATGENCSLSSAMGGTIGTLPITSEVTLDGALAVQGVAKPQAGGIFATLKFEGEVCAETAKVPIKGTVQWLAPTGQDGRVSQLANVNISLSSGELEGGDQLAFLELGSLGKLASSLSWSFM
jgi:hypothetical protein